MKTHENAKKNIKNDRKSNNGHFEIVLLKKLIYV